MLFRQSIPQRQRRRSRILLVAAPVLLAWLGAALLQPILAREPGSARRDIAALLQSPRNLRIGVVGDSIAGDLGNGLLKVLAGHDNLKVVKFTKPATGLMRDDVFDWNRALASFLAKNKLDVIVVMIGGNDRQSIWLKDRRLTLGSEPWLAEYNRRLARFMSIVAKEKARVYWVGLPVVRSAKMSRDYRALNRLMAAQARKRGFTYVSTWEAFSDEDGGYTSFGPGVDGVKRQLRKNDGIHFSIYGELRLAHLVARAISRDLDRTETAN